MTKSFTQQLTETSQIEGTTAAPTAPAEPSAPPAAQMTIEEMQALLLKQSKAMADMQADLKNRNAKIEELQRKEQEDKRERRTVRVNLLVRPSVVAKVKKGIQAGKEYKSLNDFFELAAEKVINEYMKEKGVSPNGD